MKYFFLFILITCLTTSTVNAQIGIGTTTPDDSSVLDIESTEKGVLIPRLTSTQRDAIVNPETSLMIFNTSNNRYEYNVGTSSAAKWVSITYNPTLKYSNTDTTTNINVNTATTLPIFGNLEWNDDTNLYEVMGHTVIVKTAGKYRLSVNIAYNVPTVGGNSDQRVSVEAQFAINDINTGSFANNGYVRHANGHTEASLHLTEVFNLNAGDEITVTTKREGNSAAAFLRSTNTSNIFIEKVN
jgi:hypothetical protein